MIKLICVNCGNYTYFETDVQGIRSVEPTAEGMIIKDSIIENSNYTDETIRGRLGNGAALLPGGTHPHRWPRCL